MLNEVIVVMKRNSIIELFKVLASKYSILPLANCLLTEVEFIDTIPKCIRVYTDFNQFSYALSANQSKYPGIAIRSDNKEFIVNLNGNVYVYALSNNYTTTSYDKYNSVFLGVDYKSNSFNKFSIIEHDTVNGIEYFIYVDDKSPKCLRFGIVGTWSDKDLNVFNKTQCSNFFS